MPEPCRSKGDMAVALLTVRDGEATEVRRAPDTGALCRAVLRRERCQRPWEGLEGVEMREVGPSASGGARGMDVNTGVSDFLWQ